MSLEQRGCGIHALYTRPDGWYHQSRERTAATSPLKQSRYPLGPDAPARGRRRDSLVIAAWVWTLSWPARPAGIRSGSLPGLTRSALTVPCGTLCGWESSGSWRSTFSEVVGPQGSHTATFAWPSRDLRRTQLRSSARSSAGQSSCLLSRRAGVRIPPGALNCRSTSENAGETAVSTDVAAFRQLLTGSASLSAQEQVVCLYGPGRGVPRPDSYSAQRADNWRSHSPPAATKMLEPREVVVVISTGWMCVLEGGRLPARHRRSPAARHEMGPVHLVRHTPPGRHGRKSRPCHRRGRY